METDVDRFVYVASPLGFSHPGSHYLETVLHPAIATRALGVLDPWAAAARVFDKARPGERAEANFSVGKQNASMIRRCDAVFAVLDGSDVDSGTAAEIGFACAIGKPIVGWRSDLRHSGDNEAARVNLQVEWFISASGGRLCFSTLDAAVDTLAATLRKG